jgi:EAL domain-containing protein (putative c-di-GMP-specific phosphodiesterase class I)
LGLTRRRNKYTLELAFLEMEGVKRINLAVNISGASEAGSTTPDHLLSLVQMHSGVADWLIFEIRETVAMMDFEEPAGFANKRPELGCRISLDDFGASYASCQHLKNLAADIMKFDGQFAKGPLENKGN